MKEIWFNPEHFPANEHGPELHVGAVFTVLDHEAVRRWHYRNARKLGDLLLAKEEFPYKKGDFDLQPASDYDRERCIAIGQTIVAAKEHDSGKTEPITRNILKRVYIMTLGPESGAYCRPTQQRRFVDLTDFRNSVGSARGHEIQRFDNWTRGRLRKEARKIDKRVTGKPTEKDYNVAAANGSFPSREVLKRIFPGGINAVNELNGYPNVPDMDEQDYLEYGRHFWEINGEELFKPLAFNILANRGRGPGRNARGSIFQSTAEYREKVARHMFDRQQKIIYYRKMVQEGELPIDYGKFTDDTLLRRGARYEFIDKHAPWLDMKIKQKIAISMSAADFIKTFSELAIDLDAQLTPGLLEVELDYFDLKKYMWPRPAYYRKFIRISISEFEDAVNSYRKMKRESSARRKSNSLAM